MIKKLTLVALIWTLLLIMLGAYVRLNDAGLGCPDWPGCYGEIFLPNDEAAIAKAQSLYPDSPIEAHKASKEMWHRYAAGGLGLLIFVIIASSIKTGSRKKDSLLPLSLGGLLLFQATLGMWTVTLLLKPVIVTAHLLGGMLTLALLGLLYLQQNKPPATNLIAWSKLRSMRGFALFAWACVFLQIALGGWVSSNYAALACYDFPKCQQFWIPPMDFQDAFHLFRNLGASKTGGYLSMESLTAIHWLHRVGAVAVFIILISFASCLLRYRVARVWAGYMLALLVLQISLGIANVLLSLPLWVAVLHNGGAAILLLILTLINAHLWQTVGQK